MSNKVFLLLVVILSVLIICATGWLVVNIVEYNIITNSSENKLPVENEEVKVMSPQPTAKPTQKIEFNPATEKPKKDEESNYILQSNTKEITRS